MVLSLCFAMAAMALTFSFAASFEEVTVTDVHRREAEDHQRVSRGYGGEATGVRVYQPPENGKERPELHGFEARIVGGTDTARDDYPQFARINKNGFRWCGGVLVHPKFVLTASHCDFNGTKMSVTINAYWGRKDDNLMDRDRIDRNVVKKMHHSRWNSETMEYDFMLLELDVPVDTVSPIKINNDPTRPKTSENITVVGLGALQEKGVNLPDKLQHVVVNAVSQDNCNSKGSYNGRIKKSCMFCASAPMRDSCFGDSGGPALDKDGVLLGLVSFGVGCAREKYPGVYSKASAVFDWIEHLVCPKENKQCLDGPLTKQEIAAEETKEESTPAPASLCTNMRSNVIMMVPVPGVLKANYVVASCSMVSRSQQRYCKKIDRRTKKLVWEVCRLACPKQSGC